MTRTLPAPGERLRRLWARLSPLPGGSWLFSRLVGLMAPYSGTIGARVVELAPGRCVAELRERRRVRNHLDSVHAVALANLGELTTGLATVCALPPGWRGIVVGLRTEFHKKARGRLRADCETALPRVVVTAEHVARAKIRDADGDVVAVVEATWRIAPPASRAAEGSAAP